MSERNTDLIDLIIRDVSEIERDPLLDQHPDEMRVTADELRAILEQRLADTKREADIASLMASLDICRSEAEHIWNDVAAENAL